MIHDPIFAALVHAGFLLRQQPSRYLMDITVRIIAAFRNAFYTYQIPFQHQFGFQQSIRILALRMFLARDNRNHHTLSDIRRLDNNIWVSSVSSMFGLLLTLCILHTSDQVESSKITNELVASTVSKLSDLGN